MKFELLGGGEQIRDRAVEWDDLWQRSATAVPTARAVPLLLWQRHFHPRTPLRAALVRDSNRLVAALPLVLHGPFLRVARLPHNDWLPGGTLLVDQQETTREVAGCLLDGLRQLPFAGALFRNVPWNSPMWKNLVDEAQARGWPLSSHRLHEVGLVDLERPWQEIEAAFSGNHRRHMHKAMRRAEKEGGGFELRTMESFAPGELERALRIGFEIETRGWKGREGTCVLQQPGLFEFVVRQAEELARLGFVRLIFLEYGGVPIAFEYCWRAKGVSLTPKIGYDEAYSRLSPGQILIYLNLKDLVQTRALRQVDFTGPMTDATSKWCTGVYESGTVVLGQPSVLGRMFVYAYQQHRALKERRAPARAASDQGRAVPRYRKLMTS